jgi:hypothetical protein
MPEARKFERVVGIGRTYADVLARLDEALADPADDGRAAQARMAAVAPHSWDCRFRDLETALASYLGPGAGASG